MDSPAPENDVGIRELARAYFFSAGAIVVGPSLGGLLRVKRYRAGSTRLGMVMALGSLSAWKKYLDLAYPTKPSDWVGELGRIEAKMSEPGRMKALQAMTKSAPTDAGAQLPNVKCPVLVVEGGLDVPVLEGCLAHGRDVRLAGGEGRAGERRSRVPA